MKYPFVKQLDLKDCGVSCLLMITRYYGGGVSLEYLRDLTHTTKNGVSAYDLVNAANVIGFDSYGASGDFKKLDKKMLPCISHVIINRTLEHFIVIYDIDRKNKKLLVGDPAKKSLTKISFKEYEKITDNKYIFLTPNRKISYTDKNNYLKKLFINFLHLSRFEIIIISFTSLFIVLLNILLSFNFKIFIDYVINYKSTYNILLLLFIFLNLILFKNTLIFLRDKLLNKFNHLLDKKFLMNVYNHILSLPYLYYKNRTTGEITSRIDDVISIRNVIGKFFVTVLLDVLLAFVTLIALFMLNSKLTLILLIILFLLLVVLIIFYKPLDNNIENSKKSSTRFSSFLIETINSIETILGFNIKKYVLDNFNLKYSKYNKDSYRYNSLFNIMQFIKNIIIDVGNLIILVYGSILVVNNKFDIAGLITYIMLMNYLIEPFQNILDFLLSFDEAKISFRRISELYEIEEVKDDFKSNLVLNGNIKTNSLSYSYNGVSNILDSINLMINKGDKVLIYGDSGSGKSTLAKILSKKLDVNNNMIYYDDIDINHLSNQNINNQICYVSQDESLFTDTIYQNIVLDKNISYKDFLDNAKLCDVDSIISNKNLAYDMLLEENGFNISGGQRQKIILARALLKDASIYIFDESLNEIDISMERVILERIFDKYKDKTFIVISHRFHNQNLFNKKYRIESGVSYEE